MLSAIEKSIHILSLILILISALRMCCVFMCSVHNAPIFNRTQIFHFQCCKSMALCIAVPIHNNNLLQQHTFSNKWYKHEHRQLFKSIIIHKYGYASYGIPSGNYNDNRTILKWKETNREKIAAMRVEIVVPVQCVIVCSVHWALLNSQTKSKVHRIQWTALLIFIYSNSNAKFSLPKKPIQDNQKRPFSEERENETACIESIRNIIVVEIISKPFCSQQSIPIRCDAIQFNFKSFWNYNPSLGSITPMKTRKYYVFQRKAWFISGIYYMNLI